MGGEGARFTPAAFFNFAMWAGGFLPRIVLTPDFDHASRGPKGNGQTRRVSSVLTARRAAPSDEYAQAGSRRRGFLSGFCLDDRRCARFAKGRAGVGT